MYTVLAFFYWSCPWFGNILRLTGCSLIRTKSLIRTVLEIYWHRAIRIIENSLYRIDTHMLSKSWSQNGLWGINLEDLASENEGIMATKELPGTPGKSILTEVCATNIPFQLQMGASYAAVNLVFHLYLDSTYAACTREFPLIGTWLCAVRATLTPRLL